VHRDCVCCGACGSGGRAGVGWLGTVLRGAPVVACHAGTVAAPVLRAASGVAASGRSSRARSPGAGSCLLGCATSIQHRPMTVLFWAGAWDAGKASVRGKRCRVMSGPASPSGLGRCVGVGRWVAAAAAGGRGRVGDRAGLAVVGASVARCLGQSGRRAARCGVRSSRPTQPRRLRCVLAVVSLLLLMGAPTSLKLSR